MRLVSNGGDCEFLGFLFSIANTLNSFVKSSHLLLAYGRAKDTLLLLTDIAFFLYFLNLLYRKFIDEHLKLSNTLSSY